MCICIMLLIKINVIDCAAQVSDPSSLPVAAIVGPVVAVIIVGVIVIVVVIW